MNRSVRNYRDCPVWCFVWCFIVVVCLATVTPLEAGQERGVQRCSELSELTAPSKISRLDVKVRLNTPEPAMPEDDQFLMLPRSSDLSISNEGSSPISVRLEPVPAGSASRCVTLPARQTWRLVFDEVQKLAGSGALAVRAQTSPGQAPAAPAAYVILKLSENATAAEETAFLEKQRLTLKQGILTQGEGPIILDITSDSPRDEVSRRAQPLSVTRALRIRNSLTSPGERLVLYFLDDAGNSVQQVSVEPGGVQEIPVALVAQHAGPDGVLPFRVERVGAQPPAVVLWTGFLAPPPPVLQSTRIVIPLEVTGIGNWRFLNPRRAELLQATTILAFVPRVPGRTFTVAFPAIPKDDSLIARFREAGFEPKCTGQQKKCSFEFEVQSATRELPGRLLIEAYAGDSGLVSFQVAFFEQDFEPANPSGWLRIRNEFDEPGTSASFGASAFAGFIRDPYFEGFPQDAAKSPQISSTSPLRDQHRTHLAGNVRLLARPQMGTRANAEIELVLKDRDFGVGDSPTVTTQKARLNVFGINGFTLSLGRYDVAAPTRSIAINETGEGFGGRWRMISSSYLVRPRDPYDIDTRPKPDANAPALTPAQPSAMDRWSSLSQLQGSYGVMRFEGSALFGRRQTYAGGEGFYRTLGGDILAAGGFRRETSPAGESAAIWRMAVGGYHSSRQARASDVVSPDGDKGWVYLADGTISTLAKDRKPRFTFGATWGRSSADDPNTAADESYIGESQSFTPDRLFLAVIAPKLAPLTLIAPDPGEQPRLVRRGLSGKGYYGVGFVVQGFSPIAGLLRLAQVPATDIGVKTTTFRFHRYSLRNGVANGSATDRADRALGRELMVEFLAESPKGVRYSLTGAVFTPEDVLKAQGLVTKSTWLFDARVTIALR